MFHLVKTMFFPLVMYGRVSWTIKKASAAAAAAAKSLQSCPTLCDPIDGSPPGFPIPGILQARILEWVVIAFSHKESWALKNWCFWTVMLEKTLQSPLDYKEIQPVHAKGDQSWIFIERTDAEAETQSLSTWWEELTRLKRPWGWERLKSGGEVYNRGWDG